MNNQIINDIDNTVQMIKLKDNRQSFSPIQLLKFEFIFFLTMEIVRYELQTMNRLSDKTSDALSLLFTFQCFEYYYRDFPDVYKACSLLSKLLENMNEKFKHNQLPSSINGETVIWTDYITSQVQKLMSSDD